MPSTLISCGKTASGQLPAAVADQPSLGVLLLLHQVISPHSRSLRLWLFMSLLLGMLPYVHATPVHALLLLPS